MNFTTNSVSSTKFRKGGTIRPNVPAPVRNVIDKHGTPKQASPLKKFWLGLKKTFGFKES